MKKILQINASIFGQNGMSSTLSQTLLEGLQTKHSDATVIRRDLSTGPIPHFDAGTIASIGDGTAELADKLIDELKDADTVIIGAPMYNFSVPSQLKAWFDHITRAGVSFKYTENGPIGLLGDKKVYVIITSGGEHADTARDSVAPWLKTMLNFIGLDKQLHIIRASGLAMSAVKESALKAAEAEINALIEEED